MENRVATRWMLRLVIFAAAWCLLSTSAQAGDDPPAPQSALVKLLKSGRVPAERQSTIIEMIGKRGTSADLGFLYDRALAAAGSGFPGALRVKALDALAEAALARKLRPSGELARLISLFQAGSPPTDVATQTAAIRLAGAWKLEAAADLLGALGQAPATQEPVRAAALEALAEIGGRAGKSQITALSAADKPPATRALAIAALARLDLAAAAARAADFLPHAAAGSASLTPLLAAFLHRQGGSEALAAALKKQPPPPDAAKLALRAVYALGQGDGALVADLTRAAGLSADLQPLSPEALAKLVAEVNAHGDPARGEAIFRRSDLNCMSCHAVSKAGGDVGPDLSAVGQSSPPDYIINSILIPDQSIKEQYHTQVVLTDDGQVFQGIVTDKDTQRVVLKEATGGLRVVPVESIADQKPGGSLMPKGLVNLMTRAEFVDLVRFLSELGKPGAYAIRSTPSIQRWRVLKATSEALRAGVPDSEAFRSEILRAAADRWSSAYGKVAGALPLRELTALAGGSPFYLQGEIDVTTAGIVRLELDSPAGVRWWVDDQPTPAGAPTVSPTLAPGRHLVTLRVDAPARPSQEIRLDVQKPAGSPAQFTVIGGR
jgi:putative heme-binding domain-containing protein